MDIEDDDISGVSWAYDFASPIDAASAQRGMAVLVEQRAEESTSDNVGTTLFVASTDSEDRAMDVVKQDWRLRNFRNNPVILDNHNHMRVVGRSIEEKVPRVGDDAGKLMIRVRWDLENPDPSVRSVGHQHINGFRKAGSVGFRHGKKTARNKLDQSSPYYREPTKVETWWGGEYEMSGFLFENNELHEFSSASIPMNPEALQRSIVAAYSEVDLEDIEHRAKLATEAGVPRDLVAELREYAAEPANRKSLLDLLWPDLVARTKSDPEMRRVMRVLSLSTEAAESPPPPPVPSFAGRVLALLKESP